MAAVHWLGAGLSSVPGIRRLAQQHRDLVLWNRTLSKAEAALEGISGNAFAEELNWDNLANETRRGDVLVSMLPATLHGKVAEFCLSKHAHFVSSSYVSPDMQSLSRQAADAGLCFVNEVGLDPGIDHLLAHALMADYQASEQFATQHRHFFRSYCGGFPQIPNDFRYKFSWSPLGVLRALKSKAQWIEHGVTQTTDKPWTSITQYTAHLPGGVETFQAYPNRDSLPFMAEYGFRDDWNVQQFVRGTLRLNGWAEAWSDIFALVESAEGEEGEQRLAEKSDELWQKFSYEPGERDRVVLCVELEVRGPSQTVWHQVWSLDEAGNERGTAMARLVSLTTSIAVEAVLEGKLPAGVSAAPRDLTLVKDWLRQLGEWGENFEKFVIV